MLTELLDRLLGEVDSSRDPRDIVAETQRIHSIALYEIVRQVSVQCLERGALLKRIWECVLLLPIFHVLSPIHTPSPCRGYSQQFDSLWKETQVYVDKANADAEAAVVCVRVCLRVHALMPMLYRLLTASNFRAH